MAKRVGGFVVHNQEIKEKWDQLLALHEAAAASDSSLQEPEISPGDPQPDTIESAPAGNQPPPPENNPAEAEPDPHANIGEPVPIVKVSPKA